MVLTKGRMYNRKMNLNALLGRVRSNPVSWYRTYGSPCIVIWTRGVFAFLPSRSKSTNQADIRYSWAYSDELIQIAMIATRSLVLLRSQLPSEARHDACKTRRQRPGGLFNGPFGFELPSRIQTGKSLNANRKLLIGATFLVPVSKGTAVRGVGPGGPTITQY